MKKVYLALPIIVILLFLLWPTSYSDEEKIQQTLHQLVTGLADKDLATVMDTLCETYADTDGLTKKSIRGLLFQRHQRKQALLLRLTDQTINLQQTTARVHTQIEILEDSVLTLSDQSLVFDVHIHLQTEEGLWCISGHQKTLVE